MILDWLLPGYQDKNLLSTAYHPQTDGGTEQINQMLEHYLRIFTSYQQDNWVTLLNQAEFSYNNSLHSTTRTTPFYANYGYHPSPYSDPNQNHNLQTTSMEEHLEKIKQAHIEINKSLQHTQAVYTKYYNKKSQPRSFSIGDHVILFTKNLTTWRPSKKLNDKFIGPFEIIATWGSNTYTLCLPKWYSHIHPTFHVSLLEPYHYHDGEVPPEPQPIVKDNSVEWEVDTILDKHIVCGEAKYLISWKGFPSYENSWLTVDYLDGCQELLKEFNLKYEDALKPMKHSQKWSTRAWFSFSPKSVFEFAA